VDDSYDGYKLGKVMTREFIDDMIQRFKDNKRIDKKYVRSKVLKGF
jgi:serine/threonine-protein phosphatase 5